MNTISVARTKPRRQIWNFSACHVCRGFITLRNIHTETSTPPKSRKELLNAITPSRQVTVQIPFPTITTEKKILSNLKDFQPTKNHWKDWYSSGRQAVVILATPAYASWLEDRAGFIPKVLKTITRAHQWAGDQPFDLDVVCACVDGLSPSYDFIDQARGKPVHEGFSILHGDTTYILPDLLSNETEQVLQSSEKPASLTFQKSEPGSADITIPLANTLFKTGRFSTLLSSKWRANGQDFSQIEPQVERRNLALNVLGSRKDEPPIAYVPATPLSLARPIEDSLGNIVRTLKYPGDAGKQPASKELEDKVHLFLERSYSETTITVWALIIPEDIVTQSIRGCGSLIRLPKKSFRRMYGFEEYREIGHWISKGATFCRVLSGGGGWGAKAGLLSLDPQKTFSTIAEAWLDVPSFSITSPSSQQISALGDVAKPGSYIQFFTPRKSRTMLTNRPSRPKSHSPWLTAVVVGTVPSTIDDVPGNESSFKAPLPSDKHLFLRKGEFGCVSEAGMFLRHTVETKNGEKEIKETKIDLPYSYIYKNFAVKGDPGRNQDWRDFKVEDDYSLENEPID